MISEFAKAIPDSGANSREDAILSAIAALIQTIETRLPLTVTQEPQSPKEISPIDQYWSDRELSERLFSVKS